MLLASLRSQRGSVHVECRAASRMWAVTNLYAPAISIHERKCQATENKGDKPFGLCSLSPPTQSYEGDVECRDVRYFGHSRSDSFDAFESSGKTGCVLDVCFVQLVGRQRLADAVQQIRVLLMLGVSTTRAEIKLTGHEKSNDDRRTLYQGSQRSCTTTIGR